jgi:predicted phosphodiesterase
LQLTDTQASDIIYCAVTQERLQHILTIQDTPIMSKIITILGDVHGKYRRLHEIIREKDRYEYIIQIGDLGFDYGTLDNVDPDKFKVVGGNHDNMDKIIHIPHYLGDYGYTSVNSVNFFYYRGAYSIDRQYRTVGVDWWEKEQLTIEDFIKARELYREIKPKIVITHDCPQSIASQMLLPHQRIYENMTGWALNELLNIHQPDLWLFGHWHDSRTIRYGNTKFVCLDELETYDIVE